MCKFDYCDVMGNKEHAEFDDIETAKEFFKPINESKLRRVEMEINERIAKHNAEMNVKAREIDADLKKHISEEHHNTVNKLIENAEGVGKGLRHIFPYKEYDYYNNGYYDNEFDHLDLSGVREE